MVVGARKSVTLQAKTTAYKMKKILFTLLSIITSTICGAATLNSNVVLCDTISENADSVEVMRLLNVLNIRAQALDAYSKGYMDKAISYFEQLRLMNQLNDSDRWWFMGAYGQIGNYKKLIEVFESVDDYDNFGDDKKITFHLVAHAYSTLKDFDRAIYYMKLANTYFEDEPLVLAKNYNSIAGFYMQKGVQSLAFSWSEKSLETYANFYNVDIYYLLKDCKNKLKKGQQSFRSAALDDTVVWYYYNKYENGLCDFDTILDELKALAKAGNETATKLKNQLP